MSAHLKTIATVRRDELRLGQDGEDRFCVQVADGHLQLARGSAARPDAAIQAGPDTLTGLLRNPRQLTAMQRSGAITIEGTGGR